MTPSVWSLLLFSRSVVSYSFWPHGLQHARLPCPSVSPRIFQLMSIQSVMPSNHLILSCPPFFSCPQSFPASGSFPVCWLFILGGQSIGASASASVLPMNIQGWFPLGLTGLTSLLSRSDQIKSVAQSYPTLCDPMNRSTPGLPVHHQLPEFTQTHGTLKYLLQHHSLKVSVLWHSAFFMVQLSHLYMTTVKTTALTILPTKRCLCFLIGCLGLL